MSIAPGSLDPSHHYARGRMSEMERKMMSVVEQSSENEEDEAKPDQRIDNIKSSLFSTLPTELIDRILEHAISNESSSPYTPTSESEIYKSSQRLSQAANLCLVCRQFDQLARGKMYRKINISTRNMRKFLHTIKMNDSIAKLIQDLTLDSKIWTDVDENVIADIFLAIRMNCLRLKVGANESPMLPYLFCGVPRSQDAVRVDLEKYQCALQVLDLCWRDEIEVHSTRGEGVQRNDEEAVHQDTFGRLFQHSSMTPTPKIQFQHLTIDLFSQLQLAQLFEDKGYFVQEVLPNLTLLRIELPLIALQFKCEVPGDLLQGWPSDDWNINERIVEEAIQDRQAQTRRLSIARSNQEDDHHDSIFKVAEEKKDDQRDYLMMPYCPSNQVKALTLRFLLNVHRNDMTLFKLLIPEEALVKPDHSWSVRASITAHCLSSTMQKRLNAHINPDATPSLIAFPLAEYKKKTAEVYWRQKWAIANQEYIDSLPGGSSIVNSEDNNLVKVSLLLKWPNAVDAFFHYSALTTTMR